MLPSSVERVPAHTDSRVNERIRRNVQRNIQRYAGRPREEISRRLDELDREWDIERTIEANAASLSLFGLTLTLAVNRKWAWFPAVISGFLLSHAVQGWCPPVPILRRIGFRTPEEIDGERYALRFLRGDFDGIMSGSGKDVDQVISTIVH